AAPYMAGAYAFPGHRAPESPHRDSESASSVSSLTTLIDKHSPAAYHHHHAGPKQYRPQPPPAAPAQRDLYEDDVFMAANILM
ncbi:hypothetical protein H4R19_007145, partial [Coemansia spiralis]